MASCETELETRYVVKVLTGDLRIGLRAGLVLDAIARAFEVEASTVRTAARAVRDAGALALAARAGTLADGPAVTYGRTDRLHAGDADSV